MVQAYAAALSQPAEALADQMPESKDGTWCAVGSASGVAKQRRLTAGSGCLLWVILRYEALCLHATKFRLNRTTCAPNNIKQSVPNAGFLEMFDHLADAVALPAGSAQRRVLRDWGEESYPAFEQTERLLWRERSADAKKAA